MTWDLSWVIFGIFGFFFFVTSAIATFIILDRLRWNFKYVVIENVSGTGYVITKRGRARLVSFGDGGEEIFLLKGTNKWRVGYGKRIGTRQIAWGIGQDGYWYNISFGNLDKTLQEIGVYPVDRDMRYAYASTRKGIDNRYDRKSFMEKYGTVIAFGMLFLCILAMGGWAYIMYHGQVQVTEASTKGVIVSGEVMDKAKEVLTQLANIKTGGSGAVTVTPPSA